MKLISYYDLLGMIKEGNIPEKVVYRYGTYTWDGSTYQTGNRSIFLSDIYEKDMFKKNIEILDDDFEDIEKPTLLITENNDFATIETLIDMNFKEVNVALCKLIKNQKKIINMLKEDK